MANKMFGGIFILYMYITHFQRSREIVDIGYRYIYVQWS